MTNPPVKLAIIGLGMASKPHFKALKLLADTVEVTGVYARNPERRAEVSAAWDWPSYESIEAICADQNVEAVLLITPPNARAEIVAALAGAGKHILMEKPVERSLANAQAVVACCAQNNVHLGMVLQHRFRAGAEALSALVANKSLGALHMVRLCVPWWRAQSYYDQPGRGDYDHDGGGVLLTQAIHVLDLMLSLTGPAARVQAMAGTTPLHKMQAEDFATAGVQFECGAIGSVVATTASYPGGVETLEIDAEHASAKLTSGELVLSWRDGRTETVGEVATTGGGSDPMDFPCDWHRDVIADFADAVRNDRPPRVTGREALRVHALIDAIERSAASGNSVDVEVLS